MKTLFKDIPCIKDQAYFIIVGINGSWLWNSMYPHVEDEKFCKSIVDTFTKENDVDEWPEIQQHVDDSYEEQLTYRLKRLMEADDDDARDLYLYRIK